MDDQRTLTKRREIRGAWLLSVLAALIGLGLLAFWARPRATSMPPRAEAGRLSPRDVEPAAPAAEPASPSALTPAAVRADSAREREHPHPITADHLRNFRQVDLLDDAWQALKARNFRRARELVAVHRAEYPDQWDDMNEGLELLADCMEQRDSESVARAREFYEQYTASRMRRRIRRFCLEAVSDF